MHYTVADLAATLAASTEDDYVRVVADWLTHGEVTDIAPPLTGKRVPDALVAGATAYLARRRGQSVPAWTNETKRLLESFWHPGRNAFFAYALAHAPAELAARGILIERDSLVSV